MIPKDTFTNLYLGIYHAENVKEGRTVRGSGLDCPVAPCGSSGGTNRSRGSWGRGATLGVLKQITDRPRRGVGPSAHLADHPRGRRGLSARATCRLVPGREEISLLPSFLFPKPQEHFIPLSFLLFIKEKAPSLGILIRASLDCPSTSPDSPRDSPPCHPGIFSNISFSLSDFEKEDD
jgi:hypothetical protein